MKKILSALLVVVLAGAFTIAQDKAAKPEEPKTDKKASCDMAKAGKECDMKKANMKEKDCCMKSASAKGGDCCKNGKMKGKTTKEKTSKSM